jgi:glycosyltransferase involved in cell wall biosynthesis
MEWRVRQKAAETPLGELDVMLRRLALLGYAPARIGRPGPPPARAPRVSVVIPCYNYGHYIPGCVDSVLTQPGVNVDVLIIDDASPDRSGEVIRRVAASDSRVRAVYHERNRGHIATYNEGLFQVGGDYVVLLSADDLLAPGSLARATALMESNPGVGLVYGPVIDFAGASPPSGRSGATSWTIWRGQDWLADRCRTGRNALRSPEAVMRTSVLRTVGGYQPALPHAGDFEVWMRAASVSDVGYIGGTPQAYYRVHSGSMHNAQFERATAKGVVIDLRQRYDCFLSVLADSSRITGAGSLLSIARRSLAREALTLAIRSYEWGEADRWPVAELVSFAEELCPPSELRSLWRALALRRKVGTARCRRHPAFLPSGQMYKLHSRVVRWRWQCAGV